MSRKLLIIILIVVVVAGAVIGGTFAWRYWQTSKQEEKLEPEVEVPADWKTYRNEEYKYELKYPNQVNYDVVNLELVNFYYELDQASEDIKQYLFKDNLIMYVLVGKNENNLDLEIWVRQKWEAMAKKGGYSFGDFTKSIKPITFNNMKAVEQIDNVGRISINIAKDKNVYSIYYDKHRINELDSTINQMLSTFKFIE